MPAGAQFFGDRTSVPERARPQRAQLREFFPFQWWGGERGGQNTPFFGQPARPPVDYSKAPPPHKQEAPLAATVLVIGNSLADWLGYGLEEALADTPEVGVVRKIKGNAGLIRYEFEERYARLVAGREGIAGERKAECHCGHARLE